MGPRRLRYGAVLAALASLSIGLAGCGSGPSGVPHPPRSVIATASTTSTSVTVRWVPSAVGVPADRFLVAVHSPHATVGQVVCTGRGCRSVQIPGLLSGISYTFSVRAGDDRGYSPAASSGPAAVVSGCPTAAVCLSVDGTHPQGPMTHALSGLLHGISSPLTPPAFIAPLEPRFWRIAVAPPPCDQSGCAGYKQAEAVATYDPSVIAVLSDAWYAASYAAYHGCSDALVCAQLGQPAPFGGATAPWADWTAYDTFITTTVRNVDASGHQIGYWDLVNEPPGRTPQYDTYFPARVSDDLTAGDLEQWLLHTYRDVKRADPAAKVVCPSLERYVDYPGEAPPAESPLDLSSFLDFAASNGLRCDAFSWHEISSDGAATDVNNQPEDIEAHVARFRALLARHPALGPAQIFIGEYGAGSPPGGSQFYDAMPGWSAGYLAAMTAAGVDEASRSCNSAAACYALLDDLLVVEGGVVEPSATYWPYWYYAQMAGRILPTASTAEQVSVLASEASGPSGMWILGGRHETVDGGGVSTPATPGPESVSVTVTVPWAGPAVAVLGAAYPDIRGALKSPALYRQTLPVAGGHVTINIPDLGPEDAFALTLHPAS